MTISLNQEISDILCLKLGVIILDRLSDDRLLSRILKIQCGLLLIIFGVIFLTRLHLALVSPVPNSLVIVMSSAALFGLFMSFTRTYQLIILSVINAILRLFMIAIFPASLLLGICLLLTPLVVIVGLNSSLTAYISLFLFILCIVPYFRIILFPLTSITFRIVGMLFYWGQFSSAIVFLKVLGFNNNQWLSFCFFLFAITVSGIVVQAWGYHLPALSINSQTKGWWLILPIVLVVALIYATGLYSANWSSVLQNLSFPFRKFNFVAMQAGIGEEWIFRFIVMWLILGSHQLNPNAKLIYAVSINSVLFGIAHLLNLGSQTLNQTLFQVSYAFFLGIFFSAICLSTGTIWITMMLHFLIDAFGDSGGGIPGLFTTPTPSALIIIGLFDIVEVVIAIFLLTGNRRKAVDQTIVNIRRHSLGITF